MVFNRFTKETLCRCLCKPINRFDEKSTPKYFLGGETRLETRLYYHELVSQAGNNDIIKVLIISEGHVDGDTAFSGESLKRFNAAARIPDQQVFFDIVCHVS